MGHQGVELQQAPVHEAAGERVQRRRGLSRGVLHGSALPLPLPHLDFPFLRLQQRVPLRGVPAKLVPQDVRHRGHVEGTEEAPQPLALRPVLQRPENDLNHPIRVQGEAADEGLNQNLEPSVLILVRLERGVRVERDGELGVPLALLRQKVELVLLVEQPCIDLSLLRLVLFCVLDQLALVQEVPIQVDQKIIS